MNQVTITGRAWQPEVKVAQSGTIMFSTNVGIYDGKDEQGRAKYMTIQCKAFKDIAEAAGNTLANGDNVIVAGRLSQETWTDKTTGKKVYKTILIIDCIAKDMSYLPTKAPTSVMDGFTKPSEEEIPW